MNQARPTRYSIYNGFPRLTCPTDDDADGLRFLYPECDELLPCEFYGGAERPPGENDTQIGCNRFSPAHGEYSIDLFYGPRQWANWSDPNQTKPWVPLELGRALPPTPCIKPFSTELGRSGLYRVILLFYHAMLPPIVLLVALKALCRLCLRMPWMARTRKRNEKLQRTAAKRKAEVRRMTEGGQEFAVKRAARITGQVDAAAGVVQQLQSNDASKQKKSETANALRGKLGKNKVGPEPGEATDEAPAGAPGVELPALPTVCARSSTGKVRGSPPCAGTRCPSSPPPSPTRAASPS